MSSKQLLNRSVIGGLALLTGLYLLVFYWIVPRYRRPGQMSVVEALAMDMSTMRPPEGVMPVVTEVVQPGFFSVKVTYTGSVLPWSEEVVLARVTGRLTWMPYYAGDRIRKGQLVARLDNAGGEYAAREAQAQYEAIAALHERHMAEAEEEEGLAEQARAESEWKGARNARWEAESLLSEKEAMVKEAEKMVDRADALVAEAHAMVQVKESEIVSAQQTIAQLEAEKEEAEKDVESRQYEMDAAQAEMNYWSAEIERARRLYEAKAISRDEFQKEESQYEIAAAQLGKARTEGERAKKKVLSLQAAVAQAQAVLKQRTTERDAALQRLKMAQAEKEAALSRLNQARASLKAARARLRQARANESVALAAVEQARARLKRARRHILHAMALQGKAQSALTVARIIRGYTEIRALTDGYVLERLLSPGNLVSPGTPILKIGQLDRIRVQAFVAQRDMGKIRIGSRVFVRSLDGGSARPATVTAVFPMADAATRTGLVEAQLPNRNLRWLPGQSVILKIETEKHDHVLTVPNEALTQFNGQPAVWIAVGSEASEKVDYTCPMHPEVMRDQPGRCPVCGMDLVPKRVNPAIRRADSETVYTCPMHPEVQEKKPGRCPKCGMDLVPTKRQTAQTKVARIRLVRLGPTDGNRTVVLDSLQPGDEVIVKGWVNLRDGVPVKATEGKALMLPASRPAIGEGTGAVPPTHRH